MQYCPHCGAARTASVCTHCGYTFDGAPAVQQAQQPYGAHGQQQYQPYQPPPQQPPAAYPPSPAYPQQPYQPPAQATYQPGAAYPPQTYGQYPGPYQQPPPKSSSSKTWLVVLVVVIVVVAGIAAAVMLWAATDPFINAKEVSDGETVTGSLGGSGEDKLFKIKLQPGEVLAASLSSSGSNDFDLYVYENVMFYDEYIITGSATESSDEDTTFVAWEDDYYVLDVYSYEGSGDFTLQVDIVDTVSLDDGDNSRAEAAQASIGSPMDGSVNEYYDTDDYYEIHVESGSILHAALEVPVQPNTDFDLYVLGQDGEQLGASEAAYGNEELSVYAEDSGSYYIDVSAYAGMGDYTLTVEVEEGTGADDNNDIYSATAISAGDDVSSTANQYDDADDYYEIELAAGDTITVDLDGPSSADFDLYLMDEDGGIIVRSEEYTASETLTYTADYSGTYYINVYAYGGFGTYQLSVSSGSGGAALQANAGYDRTVGLGQSVSFSGAASTGSITSYEWDFGDGATDTGESVTHTYDETGIYEITLTVTSGEDVDTDTATITVDESADVPSKWAVVVGISDYQSDGNDLNFCDEDAASWTAYLESQGYTVHTLIDSDASRDDILDEISWMEEQEQAGDYVAFVYSGHGTYSDRTRSSYICPWNDEEQGFLISDAEIGTAFENFDSQHIFIFYDSCHSGGMDSAAGPGRYISQTAAYDEYGLDAPKHEHGMWVYWFLEYAVVENGNADMARAHDVAAPLAIADAAEGGNSMHPEEEYEGDGAFYL